MEKIILRLGNGDVAISAGLQVPDPETVVGLCFLEQGLGAGRVGSDVPDRPAGKPLFPDDVTGVILEFANQQSLGVLVEQLQQLKTDWIEAEESPRKRGELFETSETAIAARIAAQPTVTASAQQPSPTR
jgi:hypothetical protein